MTKKLSFDNDFEEVPFDIRDKSTGEVRNFVLREFNGDGRKAYMKMLAGTVDISGGEDAVKIADASNLAGMNIDLISMCAFEVVKDQPDRPVPPAEVGKWKSSIIEQLASECERICKLGEEEKKPENGSA